MRVGDDWLDLHRAVDAAQLRRRCGRLRQPRGDVVFVEERLPLQVVEFDKIAVDEAQRADAGADEHVGDGRPERADADERDARRTEPRLPRQAERCETDLPGIARRGVARRGSAARGSIPISRQLARHEAPVSRVASATPFGPCQSPAAAAAARRSYLANACRFH